MKTPIESVKRQKLTPIKALRLITGMFDPKHAVHILAFANLIARKLDNCELLEDEFLIDQFKKINIEIDLSEVKNDN